MEELFNAAKNLFSYRETYFDRHPEIRDIVDGVYDPEYTDAWDKLQEAIYAITLGLEAKH